MRANRPKAIAIMRAHQSVSPCLPGERTAAFALRALALSLACSPTEIVERRFQSVAQTCYEFPALVDAGDGAQPAFNEGLVRPKGCEGASGASSSDGAAGAAANGGGANASGGATAGAGAGGSGEAGSGDGVMAGGAGGADAGATSTPTDDPPPFGPSGACAALAARRGFTGDDDTTIVLALFAAPVSVGGCQNDGTEGGCHEPGTTTELDLITPGVIDRLRGSYNPTQDTEYECRDLEPTARTWITIGGDETTSFLWQKVNSDYFGEVLPAPPCGDSMPSEPGTADSLDASDRQCLLEWVRTISLAEGT